MSTETEKENRMKYSCHHSDGGWCSEVVMSRRGNKTPYV